LRRPRIGGVEWRLNIFELLESSTDSETEKEMLRSVGFSRSFASATEFVKALIAELTADAR